MRRSSRTATPTPCATSQGCPRRLRAGTLRAGIAPVGARLRHRPGLPPARPRDPAGRHPVQPRGRERRFLPDRSFGPPLGGGLQGRQRLDLRRHDAGRCDQRRDPTAYTAFAPDILRIEGGSFGTVRENVQASRIDGPLDALVNATLTNSEASGPMRPSARRTSTPMSATGSPPTSRPLLPRRLPHRPEAAGEPDPGTGPRDAPARQSFRHHRQPVATGGDRAGGQPHLVPPRCRQARCRQLGHP